MGRLTKQGIDYFSLDVQFDDKTELYLIETESTGLAVMITLWQLIYQNEGYYIKHTDDLCLLIKRRINASINDINACINVMLKRHILDYNHHKKYKILTSRAIQKRYFDAAKRKKEVNVISEFAIVDLKNHANLTYIDLKNHENLIYVDMNDKDVDINGKDVGRNATKEEVKVKGEEEGEETTLSKDDIPCQEIINYLNLKTGRNFKASTPETKILIKARWDQNFTLEDFKTVIDNKTKEWLTHHKYSKYLRPQTLFGTKFESYLNEKHHPLEGVVSEKTIRTIENLKDLELT